MLRTHDLHRLSVPFLAALSLIMAHGGAVAQQAEGGAQAPAETAPAPAQAAQPGEQPAEDPVRATHGDWEVRCTQTGQSICYLTQVVDNAEGSPLLRAVLRKTPANQNEAVAVLTVQAPLGVVLPRGLSMAIDGEQAQQAPFLYCVQNGCYSQIAMTQEGLDRLRRGANAPLTVYSVQRPEEPVTATLSLMGFTRAYDELE